MSWKSINLKNELYYAELSKNPDKKDYSALGNLPVGYKLRITYKGKSVITSKGDVGAGGPKYPKIDIHFKTLEQLGVLGFKNCDNFLATV